MKSLSSGSYRFTKFENSMYYFEGADSIHGLPEARYYDEDTGNVIWMKRSTGSIAVVEYGNATLKRIIAGTQRESHLDGISIPLFNEQLGN